MSRIKDQIKGYFTFNRTEQRGIIILITMILIVILINILLPYFIESETPDYSQFKKEIADFEASVQQAKKDLLNEKMADEPKSKYSERKLHPFPFDPNDLPEAKWKELGLSESQIKVIKKYEEKGGRFYKKEDLAKIYSIPEEEYKILEPFIRIEKEDKVKEKNIAGSNEIKPFPFDPNSLEKDGWIKMGLEEKLVNTILKYRDKGGRFYKKEDLKQIYGLNDDIYSMLEPFVEIPADKIAGKKSEGRPVFIVELNSADTLDLQQLKGIGPTFARRIVKYRDMLGGFSTKSQLLEVFGMDSARYNGIKDFVEINSDSLRKIDINSATIKQLIKHPYIEFYTAKSIVQQRQKSGKYKNVSELKDSAIIYEGLYRKLKPYLIAK